MFDNGIRQGVFLEIDNNNESRSIVLFRDGSEIKQCDIPPRVRDSLKYDTNLLYDIKALPRLWSKHEEYFEFKKSFWSEAESRLSQEASDSMHSEMESQRRDEERERYEIDKKSRASEIDSAKKSLEQLRFNGESGSDYFNDCEYKIRKAEKSFDKQFRR